MGRFSCVTTAFTDYRSSNPLERLSRRRQDSEPTCNRFIQRYSWSEMKTKNKKQNWPSAGLNWTHYSIASHPKLRWSTFKKKKKKKKEKKFYSGIVLHADIVSHVYYRWGRERWQKRGRLPVLARTCNCQNHGVRLWPAKVDFDHRSYPSSRSFHLWPNNSTPDNNKNNRPKIIMYIFPFSDDDDRWAKWINYYIPARCDAT